jgi:hypothetical protein
VSYKTVPRSKAQIRGFVNRVREIFGIGPKDKLPVLSILEALCSGLDDGGYTLEIVPIDSMRERYAETIPESKIVRIRQDVYDRENPRDLFTVCHEIGHILLHSNDTVSFARENEHVKTYENPEWQANTFAAEFLAPANMCRKMSIEEIMNTYGCSRQVAIIQHEG